MSVIRPATPADVPAILQMIHELAVYEKEPDAVRNTPELLTEALFGRNPRVFANMAENEDGEVRGFALWFLNYSTWEGVARDLPGGPLRHARKPAARATARRCCSIWRRPPSNAATHASSGAYWTGTNRPSTSTGSSGPLPMEEWSTFRLTGTALAEFGSRSEAGCPWLTGSAPDATVHAVPVAHRPRPAQVPRHAHRGALLHGAAGPFCRRGRGRRGRPSQSSPASTSPTSTREADAAELPWLLYLQGGPGGRGNRFASLGGWSKAAAKDFRILMLDQRGTGLSSPVDRNTLPLRGDARAQAEYLTHFRADSIVADAELIRQALGAAPWTVYGQSYGGFCALTYLSFEPEGLREVLITGGLGPLTGPADRVYRATFKRVAARNAEYFGWYPEDRAAVNRIARHLRGTAEHLPTVLPADGGAVPDGGVLPRREYPGGQPAQPAGGRLRGDS